MSTFTASPPPIVDQPNTPTTPHDPSAPGRRTALGFIATRRVVEIMLTVILGVGGGLLLFGANFGHNMVHKQLASQDISFPVKGSPGLTPAEFPDLQQYAGQKVDSGPKAKAYADGFIKRHLAAVAGGKTYSQVSAASLADPTNAKLQGQVATMFKGETLRGLLLYAWGWSVVSTIALYAAIGALIGFLVMAIVTIGDFFADPRIAARHIRLDA
ncbi:MAG: hypothetical protein JWL73_558 [Actinomycetia bacterium]|nr:hypothetical protein [Actinomycetes bacterium]